MGARTQAYAEVIKYPAPQNKVQGYALYKLAYVFWNKSELDKALDAFKKTIDFGVANPTLPGASKLAENARRDIVPVYALKGDPKLAYGFFKSVSGDPGGVNDKTFRMMDDLGTAYLDTGHSRSRSRPTRISFRAIAAHGPVDTKRGLRRR